MLTLFAILIALLLLVSIIDGAPYLPTRRNQVEQALALAELKKGDTIIDLGSGDGAVLIVAARQGIHAIGYEINPLLWLISIIRTLRYSRLVSIKLVSFWDVKLPKTDAVFVFLLSKYMPRLDTKLKKELPKGTKVVSYAYKIKPKHITQNNGLFLYIY